METVCQACGYQRKPTDQAPDWECPSCGKAYVKTSHDLHEAFSRDTQSPSESDSQLDGVLAYQGERNRPVSLIGIFVCALMFILVAFIAGSSDHTWALMVVVVVMPWIVLAAAYVGRDSLLRNMDAYSAFMLCVGLCFLVGAVGVLAFINSLIFDGGKVWYKGFLFALPFGLLGAVVISSLDKQVVQSGLRLVWTMMIVLAYFYGTAMTALGNRWLDHGTPTVYQVTAIGKYVHFSRGGGTSYIVTLAPWGPVPKGNEIIVHRSEFDAVEPGRSVICVAAYQGVFGITWGQQAPCPEQTSVEN